MRMQGLKASTKTERSCCNMETESLVMMFPESQHVVCFPYFSYILGRNLDR